MLLPIELAQVIPAPLAEQLPTNSQWGQHIYIEAGNKYMITATSGKGKSTLVAYLAGLRNDYTGTINFQQKNTRTFSYAEWLMFRNTYISVLYQDLRLFPQLTALENIQLMAKVSSIESKETIYEMATQLGIAAKLDQPCRILSQGQMQRVALIRALVRPFQLLLLDEPFSHLDQENIQLALHLIQTYIEKNKASLVMTSLGETYGIEDFQHIHI
jgi:ABC-type lipoprotein export system ATPase subunit